MKFIKTIELDIKHLQAYIIEDIPGKLLINNQEDGLIILTNTLDKSKNISLLEKIKIEHIFKKKDGTELLLYCPDNSRLVHIDLKNFQSTIILYPEVQLPFIPLYFWDDVECLLTTQEALYTVDIAKKTVTPSPIPVERDEHHHPTFYQCWKQYRSSWLVNFDLNDMMVVTKKKEDVITVDFFEPSHKYRQRTVLTYNEPDVIDVRHCKGTLLLVKENEIKAINIESEKKGTLSIDAPYIFKAARFMENSHCKFVTLCDYETKEGKTQLRRYEIE